MSIISLFVFFALQHIPKVEALQTIKFMDFFASFNRTVIEGCRPVIDDYTGFVTSPNYNDASLFNGLTDNDLCMEVVNCLQGGLSELKQANSAAANVVLGLLPTILTTFGPSTAEMALLSSQRPFLSILLAVGAPVLSPGKLFSFIHPLDPEALKDIPASYGRLGYLRSLRFRPWYRQVEIVISALEYTVSIVAIFNLFQVSTKLGILTVLNWGCQNWTQLIIWGLIPLAIHVCGAIGFYIMLWKTKRQDKHKQVKQRRHLIEKTLQGLQHEFQPCIFRSESFPASTLAEPPKVGALTTLAGVAVNLGSMAHLIFGTLVFSSLMLIQIQDTPEIICRYALSAIVCRTILVFELACCREVMQESMDTTAKSHSVDQNSTNSGHEVRRTAPDEENTSVYGSMDVSTRSFIGIEMTGLSPSPK